MPAMRQGWVESVVVGVWKDKVVVTSSKRLLRGGMACGCLDWRTREEASWVPLEVQLV